MGYLQIYYGSEELCNRWHLTRRGGVVQCPDPYTFHYGRAASRWYGNVQSNTMYYSMTVMPVSRFIKRMYDNLHYVVVRYGSIYIDI
ncbi:hypothetical protein GDO81_001676 [Engystomops pustulosus]|uniref:Uncharacterized protein n=1 Tax=Engystomops pustulosus TaxID=76066 RepID=A0AAV7DGU2_ENGPU|nr:hypothetical protein GDO81_001676 [Engystomops pustulosus]